MTFTEGQKRYIQAAWQGLRERMGDEPAQFLMLLIGTDTVSKQETLNITGLCADIGFPWDPKRSTWKKSWSEMANDISELLTILAKYGYKPLEKDAPARPHHT